MKHILTIVFLSAALISCTNDNPAKVIEDYEEQQVIVEVFTMEGKWTLHSDEHMSSVQGSMTFSDDGHYIIRIDGEPINRGTYTFDVSTMQCKTKREGDSSYTYNFHYIDNDNLNILDSDVPKYNVIGRLVRVKE